MVTKIIGKLAWASCKPITFPCTFLEIKFRVLTNCRLTSILPWSATTESIIRYPNELLTGTCF